VVNKYPDNWAELRQKILERDEFTCNACKVSRVNGAKLVVHHDRPIKYGGTHDESNLWALCRKCHAMIHAQIYELVRECGPIGVDYFLDVKKYAEYMRSKHVD